MPDARENKAKAAQVIQPAGSPVTFPASQNINDAPVQMASHEPPSDIQRALFTRVTIHPAAGQSSMQVLELRHWFGRPRMRTPAEL
ncbi:hypothetical protein ACWD0A_03050 [Streptomyces sp. NPDC002867]